MHGERIAQGSQFEQEVMQDPEFTFQLGKHLGSLHLQNKSYYGTLEQNKQSLDTFPHKLSRVIAQLGKTRKALQDPAVQKLLPFYVAEADKLNLPKV